MDYVHQNRCVSFTCCEVSNFKDSLGEEVNATLFLDVKNHGGEWMNRIRPDGNRLARLEVIMVTYIYININIDIIIINININIHINVCVYIYTHLSVRFGQHSYGIPAFCDHR